MMSPVADPRTEILRQVGQGLSIPLQRRVRILRELSYDLESFTSILVEQGVSAEEAHRRAAEALVPDPVALQQLDTLHTSWYRRRTRGITPDRLRVAERGALAVATAGVLFMEGLALRRVDLFGDPSAFLAPVLAAGTLLFALATAKTFQLFIKGEHTRPRAGLASLFLLATAILGLGLGGTVIDFYRLAATLEATPDVAAVLVPQWLSRSAVLLSVALLVSLAGALAWFVLSQWVVVAEGAQREILGLPHDSRPPRR